MGVVAITGVCATLCIAHLARAHADRVAWLIAAMLWAGVAVITFVNGSPL
jgi:hypothetical protein